MSSEFLLQNDVTFEKGGSNTPIARSSLNGLNVVIKQYGHEPYDLAVPPQIINPISNLTIINSILELREKLKQAGMNVPQVVHWTNIPERLTYQEGINTLTRPKSPLQILEEMPNTRLLTIEEDAGNTNMKQLMLNGNREHNRELLEEALKLIRMCPVDCAIDTNPANFTVNQKGEVYYVDLAPPKINVKGYERELYQAIFPNAFKSSILMNNIRTFLYHSHEGRKLRLFYHLTKSFIPLEIKRFTKEVIENTIKPNKSS